VPNRESKGRSMARRTLHLPLMFAAAVLACAAAVVALLAVPKEAEATFPGKNGRIAFVGGGVIYTINRDGSAKRRVTDTRSGGYPIGYSPDGKRITYTSYEGDNDGNPTGPQEDSEIYTIGVGGGGKTNVTHNNSYDESSSYSPDGRRIVYSGSDGHDLEIYTIGVNGKDRVRLTNNATNDGYPVYSPDGKRIAAWSEKGQYIYTISVHGDGKSKVVGGDDPSYSPDGRRIAYTGRRFFERDAEIYTVNVDGSHRTKVTDNDSIDYRPSYSPDGKKIAYIRGRGLNPDIYTKSVGGGGKSNKVTSGSYIVSNPSWGSRP
jgi:Tol biopolymer transport system component